MDDDQTDTQDKKFIVLHFIKSFFKLLKTIIKELCFSIGYRIINKLSRFISPYYTKSIRSSKNNIVCKIQCKNCETSWVKWDGN